MNEAFFNQLKKELSLATTPEAEEAFRAKFLARIQNQTLEERDAELAFLETKVNEIKAKVEKHLAEKQAQQHAVEA
ncbi:MAG: hypothetical protein EAZ95_04125 [Bacteroidetes bacterium]|nr:MAG: hypothetical protein EAZ95_04125 [Bacteroidota bacterium]